MNVSEIFPHESSSSGFFFQNDTVEYFDVFSVLDIIGVVFGFPVNSYVIWLIVTGTGNGLAAEFFILNLSVCEIFLCTYILFSLLIYVAPFLLTSMIYLEGLGITGRALFQCLICVERYLAVVHPVTFLKFKPLRYRVICAAVVWLAVLAFSGVMITLSMALIPNDVYFGFILAQFFLFFSIQLFCCVSVLRALKQSGPGERGREREEENHMKRRAFHLILITAVTMFITYLPIIISMLFFVSPADTSHTTVSFGFSCFLLGGLVQPFLFLQRVRKPPFFKSQ